MNIDLAQDEKTELGEYYRCDVWAYDQISEVVYFALPVVRRTPRGAVLMVGGKELHVPERRGEQIVHKRYAWPTRAEALESLFRRRTKWLSMLESRLARAHDDLECIKRERANPSFVPKQITAPIPTTE